MKAANWAGALTPLSSFVALLPSQQMSCRLVAVAVIQSDFTSPVRRGGGRNPKTSLSASREPSTLSAARTKCTLPVLAILVARFFSIGHRCCVHINQVRRNIKALAEVITQTLLTKGMVLVVV
jgi:hypothetical protein